MTATEALARIDEFHGDERMWQLSISSLEDPSIALTRYRALREDRS